MTASSVAFYSACRFGTGPIQNESDISSIDGIGTFTVAQDGNFGVGCAVEYNSITSYIAANRNGYKSGSGEIEKDDKVNGGTSGATGVVLGITLTSGTWGGGDAVGKIYWKKTTGTFQDDEDINIVKPDGRDQANAATIDGIEEGNIGKGNTQVVLLQADGSDAANQGATAVTSIHHEYASAADWIAGITDANHLNGVDLTSIDIMPYCCMYYDHDDSTPDSTALNITGLVTSTTQYPIVYTPLGGADSKNNQRPSDGIFDPTKVLFDWPSIEGVAGITLSEDNAEIEGVQARKANASNVAIKYIVNEPTSVGVGNIKIHHCIFIAGVITGSEGVSGIKISDSSPTYYIHDNVLYDFDHDSDQYGIRISAGSPTTYIYDNTLVHCHNGIEGKSTVIAKNNVVFDTTDAFVGSFNAATTNNAYSEGADPGNNGVDISGDAGTDLFTDYVGDDYSVKDTNSSLYDAGADLSSDANSPLWEDLILTERTTWDIGAFEFVGGGPPPGQLLQHPGMDGLGSFQFNGNLMNGGFNA